MHAFRFTVLAATYESTLEGFGIFGVVKETGVDDEGLAEFSTKYFGSRFPLYCDKSYSFYQALGDRKALMTIPSLWTMVSGLWGALQRRGEKEIEHNQKGEGIVQGGIILFDKKGKPKYAYEEETGSDLPLADIVAALDAMQREDC
jgi:hypothetical protein